METDYKLTLNALLFFFPLSDSLPRHKPEVRNAKSPLRLKHNDPAFFFSVKKGKKSVLIGRLYPTVNPPAFIFIFEMDAAASLPFKIIPSIWISRFV